MSRRALVLAAHGSETDPEVNPGIRWVAENVARKGDFAEVAVAFHRGQPSFSTVLDLLEAEEVVVVPLMAAEGYYANAVLPRELKKSPHFTAKLVHITPPVGTHPDMVELVSKRALRLRSTLDGVSGRVTLVVIGHGTPRHDKSRLSTEELAQELRRRGDWADVLTAFLDEEPRVETVVDRSASNAIVVEPFFISAGDHTSRDIPRRLGMSVVEKPKLPRSENIGGKVVACDQPVGTDAEIIDMVLDLASGVSKKNPGRTQTRSNTLRLGTRASALAFWQAEHVRERMADRGICCRIVPFSTSGDRDLSVPIEDLTSDSPFTDDLDQALLNGEIDLAVHSLKDLPLDLPKGLVIAAVLPRGPVTDSLVSHRRLKLAELPTGSTIGTSSPRRKAQLFVLRPDLKPVPLRGPVDARIKQVESGELDAAIVATAGLERLGRLDAETERFTVMQFIPAPGQGALAIMTRYDTEAIRSTVAPLNDRATFLATRAELEFLRPWENSKVVAVAAYASVERDIVELHGRLFMPQGEVLNDFVERGHDPVLVARNAVQQMSEYAASMFAEIGS